jgi:predicted dehydrogenase
MKKYRVGVAKLVHDHVWGDLKHWQRLENAEIVAVADAHEPLREKAQHEYGVSRIYESWIQMLDTEGADLDIVHIAAENSCHADIVEAAALHKCHVLVEKPMAATFAQAQRMVQATQAVGVQMLINWPTAWSATWQEMERRIVSGDLGELRYFKYRSAHNGPKEIGCSNYFYEWLYDAEKNGAGAYMDYCCYGAAKAARLLGRPEKVTGLRGVLAKDYPLPDDNAIIALQYPHAMAVAEASWTQTEGYVAANLIAYGSEGALAAHGGTLTLRRPGKDTETVSLSATEPPRRSGPEYLLHCLETGAPIEGICNAHVSLIAQEILDAGLRAADTGQTQILSS